MVRNNARLKVGKLGVFKVPNYMQHRKSKSELIFFNAEVPFPIGAGE